MIKVNHLKRQALFLIIPLSLAHMTGCGGGDPQSLFGLAAEQPLGTDNFRIAIAAEPSDESSGPGSPGYVPPKVHVPLNSSQYPDEPLARATVPVDDQMTIKRVFQR